MLENMIIASKPIEIAEYTDYKLAKFMISVLDEWDFNGRMIPKEVGELYHQSIVGFPIVAKLIYNPITGKPVDFAGHEVYIKQNDAGEKEVRFGTHPIGSVLRSWIEEREVAGYEGIKSCIMIEAKLWSSRFPEYFQVLDKLWAEDKVSSSWELTLSEVEQTLKGRIIKAFAFIGNCLLGSQVQGAVKSAGVLEYASLENDEIELAAALLKDVAETGITSEEQEDLNLMNQEEKTEVVDTPLVTEEAQIANTEETETVEAPEQETAALTEWDLRKKISLKCREKLGKYVWIAWHFPVDKTVWVEVEDRASELDFVLFTYEANGDDIVISEPQAVTLTVSIRDVNSAVAAKDDALVIANEKIVQLQAEVAALMPFKNAHEQAEQERIIAETATKKAELRSKMEKSKLFTSEDLASDEIASLIDKLDETAIKNMMADRFMATLNDVAEREAQTEIASVAIVSPVAKAEIDYADTEHFSVKELLALRK